MQQRSAVDRISLRSLGLLLLSVSLECSRRFASDQPSFMRDRPDPPQQAGSSMFETPANEQMANAARWRHFEPTENLQPAKLRRSVKIGYRPDFRPKGSKSGLRSRLTQLQSGRLRDSLPHDLLPPERWILLSWQGIVPPPTLT